MRRLWLEKDFFFTHFLLKSQVSPVDSTAPIQFLLSFLGQKNVNGLCVLMFWTWISVHGWGVFPKQEWCVSMRTSMRVHVHTCLIPLSHSLFFCSDPPSGSSVGAPALDSWVCRLVWKFFYQKDLISKNNQWAGMSPGKNLVLVKIIGWPDWWEHFLLLSLQGCSS